jgi:putative flavoprotein involved in K+ transport
MAQEASRERWTPRKEGTMEREMYDTVVVGGGQAGLSIGYYLRKQGRPFVILDARPRIGEAWRRRWDSLLLFTPARINGLPGMRMPGRGSAFSNKDDMADFLEAYARRFDLPVRTSTRVDNLSRHGQGFELTAGDRRFHARNLVVAMTNYQEPKAPSFASGLDPDIYQVHSHHYKNPGELRDGPVLIVGVGNSGADIGIEVAQTHETWLAGKETAHVPFRIETAIARHVLIRLVRFVGHRVLTVRTPIGRKVRPFIMAHAAPLVRVKPKDLLQAGVRRVGRITEVQDGKPVTAEGEVLDVRNVIWCTGYLPGFTWIKLPIFGERQEPDHDRGVVERVPGLYFLGLNFLYSATSDTITGVRRDAKRIAKHLARHRPIDGSAVANPGRAGAGESSASRHVG